MPLDVVVGTQWGDEGKGRIVDLLARYADYVCRYNGGDNAGHTVTVEDKTFRLHLIPSGLIHPHTIGALGNGMVINPAILVKEIDILRSAGITINPERLLLSHAAHLISPAHLAFDEAQEQARGRDKLGTTLRGIGPAYTSKVSRQGIRLGAMHDTKTFAEVIQSHVIEANHFLTARYNAEPLDVSGIAGQYREYASQLKPFIKEVSAILTDGLTRGRRLLAEGAQGTLLDLDHGTYPFVTSSNPTAAGALLGLGISAGYMERVIGVTKAFQTRVGEGPFPTEIQGDIATHLRGTGLNPWDEFGTTTGRPRRVGWLDLPLLRYAIRINGVTELALTKLDVLSSLNPVKICIAYRRSGEVFDQPPGGPADLTGLEPVYDQLPGWDQDIQATTQWEQLPQKARAYVLRIEELCGVPVRLISVGPERNQVVENV